MSAASIMTGVALVVVGAVAEPAGADPAPADLAVTASAPVTNAHVGIPYSHSFTVTNVGGSPAADSDLVIVINGRSVGPGGTTLLSPPLDCKVVTLDIFGTTGLDCPLGTLAPGQTVSRSIVVSVTSPGFYEHDAGVSTSSPEPNIDNNNTGTSATVTAGAGGTVLGVVTVLLQELLAALHL